MQKWNILVGIFCFSIFPLLIENEKNRKLTCSPLNFLFFYVWQKMEKTTVQAIFCYVIHILTNWRDVIDLVKYTVLILNVDANNLLKYLAFNGRRFGAEGQAASRDWECASSWRYLRKMAGIEKVVTVSYIKELVEKQAKTHKEVSEILRQSPPSKVPPRTGAFPVPRRCLPVCGH